MGQCGPGGQTYASRIFGPPQPTGQPAQFKNPAVEITGKRLELGAMLTRGNFRKRRETNVFCGRKRKPASISNRVPFVFQRSQYVPGPPVIEYELKKLNGRNHAGRM